MGKTSLRSESSSKSDRKFEKKLEFYTKVRETVASLGAKKSITKKKKLRSRQKKLKAYDLSNLTEFLPDINTSRQQRTPTEHKLNSKTRQKLVVKEGKQLRTVLNHPVFKSHPLEAIHQHLESTQPVTPENLGKKLSEKRKKGKERHAPELSSPCSPLDYGHEPNTKLQTTSTESHNPPKLACFRDLSVPNKQATSRRSSWPPSENPNRESPPSSFKTKLQQTAQTSFYDLV